MIVIRKTTLDDLKAIEEIFNHARNFMHTHGNPNQWNGKYPCSDDVRIDIDNDCSYVVTNDDKIVGTFAFIIGEDQTYKKIYDGAWLNDNKYCVIHRIASNGEIKHMLDEVLKYVEAYNLDVRIDTHKDNKTMINALYRNDFVRCGIIYVRDGSERIAFQRVCKKF